MFVSIIAQDTLQMYDIAANTWVGLDSSLTVTVQDW